MIVIHRGISLLLILILTNHNIYSGNLKAFIPKHNLWNIFSRSSLSSHYTNHLYAVCHAPYTCVEAENTREKIDIEKLNAKIRQIVAREQELRDEAAKVIPEIEVGV